MFFQKNKSIAFLLGLLAVSALIFCSTQTAHAQADADMVKAATEKWDSYPDPAKNTDWSDYYCTCKNKAIKKTACIKVRAEKPSVNVNTPDLQQEEQNILICKDFGESSNLQVAGKFLIIQSSNNSITGFAPLDLAAEAYQLLSDNIDRSVELISGNLGDGEKLYNFDSCLGEETINKNEEECKANAQTLLNQMDAETPLPPPLPPETPELETTIPGLELSKVQNKEHGVVYLPWIAEYVAAVFKYGITISSILAVILIIVQGIKIIISGGGEKKMEAYKTIGRVAIGMTIAWGSYAILYTINPNLVKLKTLAIEVVLPESADQEIKSLGLDNDETPATPNPNMDCMKETDGNAVNIKTIGLKNITVGAGFPYLRQEAAEALLRVDAKIESLKVSLNRPNLRFEIKSAGRSLSKQQELYADAVARYGAAMAGKYAAKPNCKNCGHLSGNAVDIRIENSYMAQFMNNKCPTCASHNDNRDFRLLKQIMLESGWSRYCAEWWHYEIGCPGNTGRGAPPNGCPGDLD